MTTETPRTLPAPRTYAEAYRMGLSFGDISPEWTQYAAIDHAHRALEVDSWFRGQFGNHKKCLRDLFEVQSLDEFVANVVTSCQGRNKANHLQAWGTRMLDLTDEHSVGHDELNGHHSMVRDFVLGHPEIFGVEIAV